MIGITITEISNGYWVVENEIDEAGNAIGTGIRKAYTNRESLLAYLEKALLQKSTDLHQKRRTVRDN